MNNELCQNNEIDPCPCCGGKATFDTDVKPHKHSMISKLGFKMPDCERYTSYINCGCGLAIASDCCSSVKEARKNVLNKWNRRTGSAWELYRELNKEYGIRLFSLCDEMKCISTKAKLNCASCGDAIHFVSCMMNYPEYVIVKMLLNLKNRLDEEYK